MTDALAPQPWETILEIGTGLGYQTAVLALLARQVWSVEIVEEFALAATMRLQQIGCSNVGIRVGDGSRGWAEHAPFDKILVSAAAELPPVALVEQLKSGGRLVCPTGTAALQRLSVLDKDSRRPGGHPGAARCPVQLARDHLVMVFTCSRRRAW